MLKNTLQIVVSQETAQAVDADTAVVPQARTLCLVDVENMACSSQVQQAKVARLQQQIGATAELNHDDHVVIAAGPCSARAAWRGWKGAARRLLGIGPDGADRALLEAIDDLQWVVDRFDRVVIASGDHIFAPAVAALKALGADVLVIAPPVGLSKQMRLAAGPDLKPLMFSLTHEIHAIVAQRQETV